MNISITRLLPIVLAGLMVTGLSACAQTADDVVSKYMKAVGGEEAWRKVNTLKAEGSINSQGNSIQLSMIAVNGKAFRTDYAMRGLSGYSIITPTRGWYFNPGGDQTKPDTMTAEQVKQGENELDLQGKLLDYKAKGHKVAYLGEDTAAGAKCYKLQLTLKTGKEETWYINKTTNYVVKTVAKTTKAGKEVQTTTLYRDYKKLQQGIMYPMTLGTENGEIVFSSVQINVPVDEKLFRPLEQ